MGASLLPGAATTSSAHAGVPALANEPPPGRLNIQYIRPEIPHFEISPFRGRRYQDRDSSKPSILVPFPFAADQHQLKNAEAFVRAGAAVLVQDREMSGRRLYEEIAALVSEPGRLERMGRQARTFAQSDSAAQRAAAVLEELTYGRP